MKGDFSRLTFRRDKHYSSVRMQQGRVLLDAEWNEQADIQAQRAQATTRDVIGPSGAPVSPLGQFRNFQVRIAGSAFEIADGQLYVDGILCEATEIVPYDAQPDYPGAPALVSGQAYHAYLDVWERHQTALEQSSDDQPQIREVALGGPDTTTRLKTIWQVKAQALANAAATCADFGPDWIPDGVAGAGRLRADAAPAQPAASDCLVPPGGGYRRLENQLYRVEIHEAGAPGTATYKWSRDNGSILTKGVKVDATTPAAPVITVSDPGKDAVLGFAAAAWVEISDEERTLRNEPGVLLEVTAVKGDRITLKNPANLALATGTRPTVRRWDGIGTVQIGTPEAPKWVELEDGVMVEFSDGAYVSGDYWTAPARSLTGQVEWPRGASGPVFEGRHGPTHHYASLALLIPAGDTWTATDCRKLFPQLTALTTLLYEGGDGQEALPGQPLTLPLRVRVVNGQAPVIGAPVQFALMAGGGSLSANAPVATIAPDGIAECIWTLGLDGPQQVQAVLLDAGGNAAPGQVLDFNATVSVASQVAYDPTQCNNLGGVSTVQEAIDKLCGLLGVGPQDEVVHIVEVLARADGAPIENDGDLPVERLLAGIEIVCDRDIFSESVSNRVDRFQNAVCFVTLDLPFPSRTQSQDWRAAPLTVLGFQTITLAAEVSSEGNNVIRWRPTEPASQWLRTSMFSAIEGNTHGQIGAVLTRLTLKGNFIWSRDTDPEKPEIYLDGNTFGAFVNGRTAARLPRGDGRRSGDFEMWFWLRQG